MMLFFYFKCLKVFLIYDLYLFAHYASIMNNYFNAQYQVLCIKKQIQNGNKSVTRQIPKIKLSPP